MKNFNEGPVKITAALLITAALVLALPPAGRANQIKNPETAIMIRFRVKNSKFHRKVASSGEINYSVKAIDSKIIKTFPNVAGLYIVRLQGKYDMKSALAKLDNFAFVIYAQDLSHYKTVPAWALQFSE